MPHRQSDHSGCPLRTPLLCSKHGSRFQSLILRPRSFRAALDIHERFQLSYWDAAIVAAAKKMGCRIIFSEDLNNGQTFDGLTVVNPFTTNPPP
jgi:predicted nucleic acid-binding protein